MEKDAIRVVIADDEPISRMDLKELLTEGGYTVVAEDMAKVSERLANRSIIEKAKGQVMQEQNLSEQEAYHYIRKLSQLKGLSMRRVAEMILVKGGG